MINIIVDTDKPFRCSLMTPIPKDKHKNKKHHPIIIKFTVVSHSINLATQQQLDIQLYVIVQEKI
jgi:hypothetical protein